MYKLLITAFFLAAPIVEAAKPKCYSTHGGYCQYTGKVKKIYVNYNNDILLYFDEAMDEGEWNIAGYNATQRLAGIINIDEKPEFAKLFYSTALAAQASKRNIVVQMRNVRHGYLKIDRIWLDE